VNCLLATITVSRNVDELARQLDGNARAGLASDLKSPGMLMNFLCSFALAFHPLL